MGRTLINDEIVADEVVLIDRDERDLGIMTRSEALAAAHAADCDLVQDSLFSSPPRCRLVPIGTAATRAARAARLAAGTPPKEIRVGTTMGEADIETRQRQAAGLLDKGYTVKLSARLAKSERANPVAARALLDRLTRALASAGRASRKPFGESGALSVLIEPLDD